MRSISINFNSNIIVVLSIFPGFHLNICKYGKHGTGKSSALIHLVHYGYESKFLLLHLPWG